MATGLPESLVGDLTIYLFGRIMEDLQLSKELKERNVYRTEPGAPPLARKSPHRFVVQQLVAEDAAIARIYAFSFQNEFFDLARPALFIVNGPGDNPLRYGRRHGRGTTARQYASPVGLTGLSEMGGVLATELRGLGL